MWRCDLNKPCVKFCESKKDKASCGMQYKGRNMIEILERLRIWREERGLDKIEFDLDVQASFIFEEIGVENLRLKTPEGKIDSLCDATVFSINALALIPGGIQYMIENFKYICDSKYTVSILLNEALELLDPLSDIQCHFRNIIVIAKGMIVNMGYDYEKSMQETLKEIESRKGVFNPESGKWEKFKDEESKKLWYKADYSKCKL